MNTLIESWKQDFFEIQSNVRFEFLKNMRRNRLFIVSLISASLVNQVLSGSINTSSQSPNIFMIPSSD